MTFSAYNKARRPANARENDTRERTSDARKSQGFGKAGAGRSSFTGKGGTRQSRTGSPERSDRAGRPRSFEGKPDQAQARKGHGRRLHGLGEDPGLAELISRYAPEKLASLPEEGSFSVHIAPRGLLRPLAEELGDRVLAIRGRAVLAKGQDVPYWAQTSWTAPFWLEVSSINDAARRLSAVQRRWAAHMDRDSGFNRRAALIEEALPHVNKRPLVFGEDYVPKPLGGFLLWDRDLVLASATTTSCFADGEVHFEEDKLAPPGRAYLKLWESFTIFGTRPAPGELCLELGAAPGSWTWVLGNLGARVFSIDKAPLASHIESMPVVNHCLGSGFALTPDLTGRTDWLFSDMICYPQRLLALVQQYIEARAMRHALCTIKFQSDKDHDVIAAFAAIKGSQIRHLSCNKHELTWFYTEPEDTQAG